MTIDHRIRDEKFQYNINKEAAKTSALSSGEEMLPSNQIRIIEQDKFTYSTLKKALKNKTKATKNAVEKQTKTTEGRVEKQILGTGQNSVSNLFSKDVLSEEAIYELNKIKEIEWEINREDLNYKADDKEKDERYSLKQKDILKEKFIAVFLY